MYTAKLNEIEQDKLVNRYYLPEDESIEERLKIKANIREFVLARNYSKK
jgi:hypothetical protein